MAAEHETEVVGCLFGFPSPGNCIVRTGLRRTHSYFASIRQYL
jgi:hypothetical protein